MKRRIIVGISGASGSIYGIRLVEELNKYPDIETHLVVTASAEQVISLETDDNASRLEELVHTRYDYKDFSSAIASGSFMTDGMVVAPCSMKTVAAISSGITDNLLTRAADVCIKERRRLILVPRETPLHEGHLRNLLTLAKMDVVILPPMPAYYHMPTSIEDIVNQTIGKILDMLQIPHELFTRWGE